MATTARLSITYPSKDQEPWFSSFESMVTSLDTQLFSVHDDRNMIVMGGGSISWNGSTVAWDANIVFVSSASGFKQTVPAGSQAVADGQFLFLNLSRGPSLPSNILFESPASTIAAGSAPTVIAYRSGTDLVFWNGMKLASGSSMTGFGGSTTSKVTVNLAGSVQTTVAAANPHVAWQGSISSDEFGGSSALNFVAVLSNSAAGVQAVAKLYNLTDGATVTTLTTTAGVVTPTQIQNSATISSSDKMYEVRLYNAGSAGTAYLGSARLETT